MSAERRARLALCALLFVLAGPLVARAQVGGSPTCAPPATAEPMRAPDPSLVLGVGAALGVVNLPNMAIGPELFAEIDAGWPIDVAVAYFPKNREEISDSQLDLGLLPNGFVPFPPDGSRIGFSEVEASVDTCPLRYRMQSGSLLACGGLFGGVLMAKSEGFVDANDETRLSAGAEAYARWHFRISEPIGITYSAGFFVPFVRDSFGFRDREGEYRELFRQPVIGGRLDVALSWWFF